MRISTNTIYQTGISKISQLQSEQSKLQQQIASEKRILTPSDDPIAAARALEITHAQNMNTQFASNRQIAETQLTGQDISLDSITELLVSTQTVLVGSAGTLSATQKNTLAVQLSATFDTLLGYANTQDANGNYLYAGLQGDTKPYTATSTGATYNGDSQQQLLQVDNARQMPINIPGDSVFQAGGNDIFKTFNDLITLLNDTSATDATVTSGVATALASIKTATTTVATVRSGVGTRLNEIDSLNETGASRDLQYAQALSQLQDLDYAQALSDLSQKQVILEAAQKSFVQTTGLSLFDYIR